MIGRRAIPVFALVLLAGAPTMAAAEVDAVRLIEQAITAFDNGAFVRSRELLLSAEAKTKDSRLLGRIHLYLGLNAAVETGPNEAKTSFRRALKHDPLLRLDADRFKPAIVRAFEAARADLVGALSVSANRDDATVWIDGARAGPPPVMRDLLAGDHVVELRGPEGTTLLRQKVKVQAGRTERVNLAVPPPPASAPAVAPTTRPVMPTDDPQPRRRRIWTWVAGAGTLAFLAVAIGTGISARSDHERACELLDHPDRECADRTRLADPADRGRYGELHDAVRAKELAANISWGIVGALAATTVVLYLVEGRASRVSVGPFRRGLTFRLTY